MTTRSSRAGVFEVDQFFTRNVRADGKVRTGLTELDEMLHGGFIDGDEVMVAGSAGYGKSILALQCLVNRVKLGAPGVYVTFDELPDQIYRDAKTLGGDHRLASEGCIGEIHGSLPCCRGETKVRR